MPAYIPGSRARPTPGYTPPPAPVPPPESPAVSALLPQNTSPLVRGNYVHEPRPVRVIFVGAGLAGVCFAYKARLVPRLQYTVYEKNADVGGVWFANRYPGVACDVPAHGYSFTFRPNPDWSRFYAGGAEIRRWLQTQAHDYGLYAHARFGHEVRGAAWDEARGVWAVTVADLATGRTFVDEAEVLVNGSGGLSRWRWPAIPGLHDFQGELLHTADWKRHDDEGGDDLGPDDDPDQTPPDTTAGGLAGKRVAVIGAGASGIQIVPALQPAVAQLTVFVRSPTWIAPDFAFALARDGHATRYTAAERQAFRADPAALRRHRQAIEQAMNSRFPSFYKHSAAQHAARAAVADGMRRRLAGRPDLAAALVPDYALGCRRVTPGPGYLEALCAANAAVVSDTIQRVEADAVVDATGRRHVVDAIVCATGFETSFVPAFAVVGRGGANLQDVWRRDGARAYFSLAVPGFPNYFCLLGPNSPISNGSLVAALERQVDTVLALVHDRLQTRRVRALSVRPAAAADFEAWKTALMQGMAWTDACTSWYKGGTADGPVVGPWPGSVNHFLEALAAPRFEDWEYVYADANRFTYLGDGRSPREAAGAPLGWYME